MIDNSILIAPFCPAEDDGDTFIYTEMLDRGKRKGNNGHRLVKTFYHRSVEEFWSQWPTIKQLCDLAKVRACTRIAPRSYAKVGREFTRLVVDASLTNNWAGMKSLYNRACGIVSPNQKLWLWDVDEVNAESESLLKLLGDKGLLVCAIPSRRAYHLISKPFDVSGMVGKDGFCVRRRRSNCTRTTRRTCTSRTMLTDPLLYSPRINVSSVTPKHLASFAAVDSRTSSAPRSIFW